MEKKHVLETVKAVTSTVGWIGTGAIIANAIKRLSPTTGMGAVMKACVCVGGTLLSGLVADATSVYANKRIDGFAADISKHKQKSEEETPEEEAAEA